MSHTNFRSSGAIDFLLLYFNVSVLSTGNLCGLSLLKCFNILVTKTLLFPLFKRPSFSRNCLNSLTVKEFKNLDREKCLYTEKSALINELITLSDDLFSIQNESTVIEETLKKKMVEVYLDYADLELKMNNFLKKKIFLIQGDKKINFHDEGTTFADCIQMTVRSIKRGHMICNIDGNERTRIGGVRKMIVNYWCGKIYYIQLII